MRLGLRSAAFAVAALGIVGWAATALVNVGAAVQGWQVAFAFWSSLPLGALALLLIHRMTGGGWGAGFAPELEPAARSTPLLLPLALPLLLGAGSAFAWAAHPERLDGGVRALFLNPPAFALRSLAALFGWSLIAWRLPRIEAAGGRAGAALGLAFHGLAVSVAAVDWVLSVQPQWTSSSFPMAFATQQLAMALAWAALQARAPAPKGALADVDGLLFATLLGLSYLQFMDYLVVWYGDRPTLDLLYLSRARPPWRWLALAALAVGAAGPTLALMLRTRIGRRRATRLAGAGALLGGLAYDAWLIAPSSGDGCLLPAGLAALGVGGVWIGCVQGGALKNGGEARLSHA